jgi:26S proteasome regulatory subunit N7
MKRAAELLLDGVATFTAVELCSYEHFIFYAVLTNLLSLPRPQIKKKIIDGPDILQARK